VADAGDPRIRAAADGIDIVCDLGIRLVAGGFADHSSASLVVAPELVENYVAAGVSRVVLVSSVSVYRPAPRACMWPITEDAALEAHGDPDLYAYGVANIAAEASLRAAAVEHVILRTSSVYGLGVEWMTSLVRQVLRRPGAAASSRDGRPMQWSHARDVAAAIVLAATCPCASGRIYNITGGELFVLADIVRAVRGLTSAASSRFDGAELKYDITAARHGLGFVPAVGLQEAVSEIVRSLERHGELAA
jgi:nucleoside-diphosphate-sugar epimerase